MEFQKSNNKNDIKWVVLTGGPGAGKTAVLELARNQLCDHVAVLPEAASIVFSGGFWRLSSVSARMASQRAICRVQQELENLVSGENRWLLGLCDRGTLDGLAYWPADEALFWESMGTSKEAEFAKYAAVIHLRTPSADGGYNHQNSFRIETASEARQIDEKIHRIWRDHPRYQQVDSTYFFIEKARKSLELIEAILPGCSHRNSNLLKSSI